MRTTTRTMVQAAGLAVLFAATSASAQPAPVPDPKSITALPPKPASIKGDFSLVSVGDLIYNRPVAQNPDPGVQKALAIVRAGDVAIANQEGIILDLKTFKGYAPGTPSNLLGDPALAKDERAIGIRMVSTANNHSSDWGVGGLLAMDKLLDDAGIVRAGDGPTLAAARAAKYLDTPKGRIALIATASSFKPGAEAEDAVNGLPPREGISTLRLRDIEVVTPETLSLLRAAAGKPNGAGDLNFGGRIYRAGAHPHRSYEMNTYDHYGILKAIHDGKQNADLAVFEIHAHENADGTGDMAMGEPGDFLVQLFHDAVDAGADVVMGGGPHSLRGIEIYKGKPIFYGLAVFIFKGNIVMPQIEETEHYGPQNAPTQVTQAQIARTQRPSWNDGVIATSVFHDGVLKEVRLYPLDHHRDRPDEKVGLYLAAPDRARGILEELQKFSTVYGTKIAIEGSVGVLRP